MPCVHPAPPLDRVEPHPEGGREAGLLHRPAELRRWRPLEEGEPERAGRIDAPCEARARVPHPLGDVAGRRAPAALIVLPLRLERDPGAHELEERGLRQRPREIAVELVAQGAPRLRDLFRKTTLRRQPRAAAARLRGEPDERRVDRGARRELERDRLGGGHRDGGRERRLVERRPGQRDLLAEARLREGHLRRRRVGASRRDERGGCDEHGWSKGAHRAEF